MGAFNGSGLFVRTYNWVQDKINGVNITASRMDTEDDGFATGLSNCVTRDGQGKMGADLLPSADFAYALGSAAFKWTGINGAIAFSANRNVTVNSPVSGVALTVNGLGETFKFIATGTAYQSMNDGATVRGYFGWGSSLIAGAVISDVVVRSEGNLRLASGGPNARVDIASDGSTINLQATAVQVNSESVSGGARAVKTADQVVALTFPQNDTHLVCALKKNTYYEVEGALYVTVAAGTPTVTWQLSATAANQIEALSIQEIQAGNNQGVSNNGAVVAAAIQVGIPSAGGIAIAYLKGFIQTNAGTDPTLTLQWCGSTGTNVTFKKGSYLEFRKVA